MKVLRAHAALVMGALLFGIPLVLGIPMRLANAADRPAVLVESISIPVQGVEAMDYLTPGMVVNLGADGVLLNTGIAGDVYQAPLGVPDALAPAATMRP